MSVCTCPKNGHGHASWCELITPPSSSAAFVFTVPMPENLTNRNSRRSHWRVLHREKLAYLRQLDDLLLTRELPIPPARPFAQVTVRSVMHLGAAMDDDNALARHKPLLDWLKKRRYIVDDRRTCLRWEALPDQVVKRDGNYRIVLTLTPVESFA